MKVKRDLSTMAQYLIWAMENRRPVTNQEIYRAVEGANTTDETTSSFITSGDFGLVRSHYPRL